MIKMIDCRIFAGKNKDVEPDISNFLKTFPPDYDMKNLKVKSAGAGGAWTHLIIVFKVP